MAIFCRHYIRLQKQIKSYPINTFVNLEIANIREFL